MMSLPSIPYPNLEVDLRCLDGIWSAAIIVRVTKAKQRKKNSEKASRSPAKDPSSPDDSYDVLVKYAGWADNWNETLPWDSDRLAPLFCYSRRVKGLVKIFTGNSNVWPCKVYFRMPTPNNDVAEDMLRLEPKVLVEPYNAEALENKYMKALTDGLWLHCSQCVEPFDLAILTDHESSTLIKAREGFAEAFLEACADPRTIGFVPEEQYIVPGTSLPYQRYRVTSDTRTTRRYDGCLGDTPADVYRKQIEKMMSHELIQAFLADQQHEEIAHLEEDVKILQRKGEHVTMDRDFGVTVLPNHEPILPHPKIIELPIKNERHIQYDECIKKWIATIQVNGSILTLGHFASKSFAADAYSIASEHFQGKEAKTKFKTQHEYEVDELKIDLDCLISQYYAIRSKKNNNFSVNQWIRQLVRHKDHVEFSRNGEERGSRVNKYKVNTKSSTDGKTVNQQNGSKKRKQAEPKRRKLSAA